MIFTTVIVDIALWFFVANEFFEFLLSCYSGSAKSAFHDLGEFEVLVSWSIPWREIEMILHFVIKFLGNDGFIGSFAPMPTPFWIFIGSIVHWIIKDGIDSWYDYRFPTSCSHRSFILKPSLKWSATHTFIGDFLKHDFNVGGSLRIENNLSTISEIASLIQVSKRCFVRKMSKVCLGFKSSDHIDTSIIVLEFCLGAENHEEEFLIGSVLEYLPVGSYFMKKSCIHEINHGSEISCISR